MWTVALPGRDFAAMMKRAMSKYFAPSEFARCVPACRIEDMDTDFLALLDKVREKAGIPMVLNCAYRSREWDLAKGRTGNSAHTRGKAVDVRCASSANRFKIVAAALECGVRRIGIGKSFVHLDNDGSLAQGVMWDYYG